MRVKLAHGWVLAAVLLLAAGAGASASSASAAPHRDQLLSNETTFTRWAYTVHTAAIYRRPTAAAPRITRLRWDTEDGYPEVYLLLRTHWTANGQEWIKLRIPARPNGQVGWVRRGALGRFHTTYERVVVDRQRLRMSFYARGQLVWSAPVAIGKPSTPTPAGHFWIREKFPRLPLSSLYYPYAFGTADYSTLTEWPRGGVVGIHGPYGASASQIPGRISHGCIRLRVPDDNWLGHHLTVGTPLQVT
jgi:L,D-transpeptidase catalytic domain